ncbi:MAG: UbiA family prenyltransferase [Candidatus Heimdallarchaeota archaeon]|nr:UbiA family prenyltransferase [Candidatus Heimdallarchaeota archaeon]
MNKYLSITRPINGIVMGAGLFVSFFVAGALDLNFPSLGFVSLFFAGYFVTAHAMVVNDIIDIEIDKINAPHRVLPSGRMSVQGAKIYSLVLLAIGLSFFAVLDLGGYTKYPYNWLWGLIHVIMSDLYNLKLKKTGLLGNIVVAYMSWALFLYPDIFLNDQLTKIPLFFGLVSFCISLSREVLKGIMDVDGDREHGINTLAVLYGGKFARNVGLIIQIVIVFLAVYIIPDNGLIGQVGIIIFIIYIISVIRHTIKAIDPKEAKQSKSKILLAPLIVFPFLIIDVLFPI